MGQDSKIEWTDHTWSPWFGCQQVSAGCMNCYAESGSARNPAVLGIWGSEASGGTRRVAAEGAWAKLRAWNAKAAREGKRHRVFPSLCDPFEDWQGPMVNSQGQRLGFDDSGDDPVTMSDVRNRFFNMVLHTPNLDWLVLTKRPENISRFLPDSGKFRNLWLGTSVENQATADERIPHLLGTPAAVRFLSCEPLLAPVDLRNISNRCDSLIGEAWGGGSQHHGQPCIDWVIAGGESGPHARPCHPDWARSLRDQCNAAGVAFFWKQWGEWHPWSHVSEIEDFPDSMPVCLVKEDGRVLRPYSGEDGPGQQMARVGKKVAGRLLDGREWNEMPEAGHA